MFIGHFALGYAAKRWAPRVSLGVLFGAAVFADLLWPVLVALGIEHVRIVPGITASTPLEFLSYPYLHSLLTLTLLGAFFAWLAVRQSLGARRRHAHSRHAVVSYGPKFGLGLWNSPRDAIGTWAFDRHRTS